MKPYWNQGNGILRQLLVRSFCSGGIGAQKIAIIRGRSNKDWRKISTQSRQDCAPQSFCNPPMMSAAPIVAIATLNQIGM
jgi:hypothetical protein